MTSTKFIFTGTAAMLALFIAKSVSAAPPARKSAQLIPAEVESQAQAIEAKFNSVISEECATRLCTPVGCEVISFRTLDEKQNSSLPGLDVSDEVSAGQGSDLQYKLSSIRCEYAYEPTLSAEAVSTLSQRLNDKVRATGLTLLIQGRKLSAANALLKDLSKDQPPKEKAALAPPIAPESSLVQAMARALPGVLWAISATLGLLALIWGVRRLGKTKLVEAAQPVEMLASPEKIVAETPSSHAAVLSEIETETEGPTAFELVNKKTRLTEMLSASPKLTADALEPVIQKGDVQEICRVLQQFGPAPLTYFSQKSQYRDLFSAVHKKFEEKGEVQSNKELWAFYEKLERLFALAQLGRPDGLLEDELAFTKDLAPDEFTVLANGLNEDELLGILSFIPARLRAHYLQSRDNRFLEAYTKHVLTYPRLSEHMLKRIARQLHSQYTAHHGEIKKISRDQVGQIEQLLNTLGGSQRGHLFESLRKESPALFDRLISEVPLDRALVQAPQSLLNDLFLNLTPDEAAAYLQAHPDRSALLAKLKAPLARGIESRFDSTVRPMGLPLDFIEEEAPLAKQARERVTEILKTKSARGEVNLRRLNESVLNSL